MNKSIIILHDVDGRIYFDGIKKLHNDGSLEEIKYYESIIFKRLIKSILYRNLTLQKVKAFWKNFLFRLQVPFIKNETILLGMAPYNIRFLWYGLLARKNRVIYHTSWPYWWGDNVPCKIPFLNNFLKKAFIYYLNNYNFYCCGISKASIESLGQKIEHKERLFNIPHAIDLSIFKKRDNKKDDLGKIKVVFVGRIVKEKGIYDLVTLAKKTSEICEFTFIGDGELLGYLQNETKNIKNVNVLGRVNDKNKIAQIISDSDIFILPSRQKKGWEELFGISIIEAMASGSIVVSTKHVGPREIISNNINGFLFNDDEKLSDNLHSFLLNLDIHSEKMSSLREKAIIRANDYSVESVSLMWKELLDKVNR